jgi:hypothetical protein
MKTPMLLKIEQNQQTIQHHQKWHWQKYQMSVVCRTGALNAVPVDQAAKLKVHLAGI